MPYQMVTEYCGRWWHFWWAGPLLYVHSVDVEDLPESYCEIAQPANLLHLTRYSIPVACVPLTYRVGDSAWAVVGENKQHYYRRADKLAKALEEAAETWPYWCNWTPVGRIPPGVLDRELLVEALLRMPILQLKPEDLAVDYVAWTYGQNLVGFLQSDFVHLTRAKRAEEKWREICEYGDPRQCYPGAVGAVLADIRGRGLVPAVDASLFGVRRRYTTPWGFAESSIRTQRGRMRVYYVLGYLLRAVLARRAVTEMFYKEEIPLPSLSEHIDIQGPIMHQRRKRKPEPVLEPIEEFPTSHGQEKGGPLAVFDLLAL